MNRPSETTRSVLEWAEVVRAEYSESPGLSLTAAQVQRLWGLDAACCAEILGILVTHGFLHRTHKGTFVRTEND
jgi:hypothetical protein